MPNYNTDSELIMSWSITFFADNQTDADAMALNMLNRIFGASTAGLMQITSSTNSPVPGTCRLTGNNYSYTFTLDLKQGDYAHSQFSSIFAQSPAAALAQLNANAQRETAFGNMQVSLNYLN